MAEFSMTTITPKEAPMIREIGIRGAMTIHHADEIRSALVEALGTAEEIRMEMTQVQEIDLTGLQLLCSAHQTSVLMHKRFMLCGDCAAPVKEAIYDSGFVRHAGCVQDVDNSCIWIQGGEK